MERVGRYRLLQRLGRGGMAEMFEAVAEGDHGFERRVAIKRMLPEGRLFGRETIGAESGQVAVAPGRLEVAEGGSILLNDIDAMSLPTQAKLARYLEEGTFERVGGTSAVSVDTRIFAATAERLGEEVRFGTFSEDLFNRLSIVPVVLPALRERRQGHSRPRESLRQAVCRGHAGDDQRGRRARLENPDRLRVARQRRRAGKRHQAGMRSRTRQHHHG